MGVLTRQLFGPIAAGVSGWLPGLGTIRAALYGLAVAALFGAGITAGIWMHGLGDAKRLAQGAKPLCEAAISQATVDGLQDALLHAEGTLAIREQQMALSDRIISKLENELKEARDGTTGDNVCVPAGSAWLQRPERPVRGKRPAPAPGRSP